LATHTTTFEITKESSLSKRGNCVIAVSADKGMNDLDIAFRKALRKDDARVVIQIECGGVAETVNAFGDSKLILDHRTEIVVRKTNHIDDRTLTVRADKAACDLSRKLVERLRNPRGKVTIEVFVKP
jgi:hypothetical protein